MKHKINKKLDTYCLSGEKAMAFKVLCFFFFTIQFKFVEYGSFKHKVVIVISYKTQNKT